METMLMLIVVNKNNSKKINKKILIWILGKKEMAAALTKKFILSKEDILS